MHDLLPLIDTDVNTIITAWLYPRKHWQHHPKWFGRGTDVSLVCQKTEQDLKCLYRMELPPTFS
jgi:hypothetical protein